MFIMRTHKDGFLINLSDILLDVDTAFNQKMEVLDQLYCLGTKRLKCRVVSEDFYQEARKLLSEDKQHLDQYDSTQNPYHTVDSLPLSQQEDLLRHLGAQQQKSVDC